MPATLSAKLDPALLLAIGDAKKASQICQAEIKNLERAAAKAQAVGKDLDAKSVQRLKRFEMVKDAADATVKREKQFTSIEHSVHRTERALKSIRNLVGIETAARIFRNGKVDFADVARVAVAGERTVLRVAKAMGMGRAASSFIRALPLIGETLHIGAEVLEYAKERKLQSQAAGRGYGSGRDSQGQFDFFQARNGVFGNAQQSTEVAKKAIEGLIKLSPSLSKDVIDTALDKVFGKHVAVPGVPHSGGGYHYEGGIPGIPQSGKRVKDVTAQEKVNTESLGPAIAAILAQHLGPQAQRKAIEDLLFKTLGKASTSTGQIDALMQIIADKTKALEENKPAIEKNLMVQFVEGITEKRRAWYAAHHRDFSPNAHFPDTGWQHPPGQHEVSNHGGFERLRQLGVAADVPVGQQLEKFMQSNHYSLFNISASRVPSHNVD